MEDFPQQPADVEETPVRRRKNRRKPNFLEGWLQYRRSEQTVHQETSDEEDDEESSDKTKERPTKSWLKRFRKLFKGFLLIDPIPKPVAANEAPLYIAGVPRVETIEQTYRMDSTESLYEPVEEEIVHSEPEIPTSGQEVVISHTETEYLDKRPVTEATEAVEASQEVPSEARPSPPEATPVNREYGYAAGSATAAGEVLRRSHEARLRRHVRKLNGQVKDLKTEKSGIKKRQETFAKQLEVQQNAYERFAIVTAPRLEKSQEQLRTRLETIEQPVVQLTAEQQSPEPIETGSTNEVNVEIRPEKSDQLGVVLSEAQPETILHTVERATEQNVPIESEYDRRHEIKDEPNGVVATTKEQAERTWPANIVIPLAPILASTPPPVYSAGQKQSLKTVAPSQQGNLYRQAMKSGFWTAAVLLILFGLAYFAI